MKDYDHKEIEPKWQNEWEENKIYQAQDFSDKPKYYALMEFPYPSGDGLHTGHVRGYTAMDVIARKRRMEGHEVMFPIGWDAFGLPTENYAIKTGKDPRIVTKERTDNYRNQFKSLGLSFDWSREINTTDPAYYKWTQWLFLQFLKHDLAYKKKMLINWCPKDKTGLANEEVVNGCCDRCGTPVEKREKEQWMLAITKYAERLHADLDNVNYLPQIKLQQRNWIGKSEGAEIDFLLNFTLNPKLNENRGPNGEKAAIKVFTTRPDTIFGATYVVLSPEHLWVTLAVGDDHIGVLDNRDEVIAYIRSVKNKTDIERTAENKEKTGVELKGVKAVNPATGEEIPMWIADYVLAGYGTGAIMAVPADDTRDREFAQKFNLPIVEGYKAAGMTDFGTKITKFKLRDWVFSRQRYWGEPIPVIHCPDCGIVPVPEKDLPVELPVVENYQPTDTGESPLANITEWVHVKCPTCGGEAKRETDTMPNWAGSSWYFLRYTDPENSEAFADSDKLKYWTPVDWYNGGNEHTTLHLLYSRFWHKFLFDLGMVPTSEPYMKRTSHGLILAEGGVKMSKSLGNVINPDVIVKSFGADTLRLYEMFMGPFDQAIPWGEEAIIGPRRFLERVWKMQYKVDTTKSESTGAIQKVIKKVSVDIEAMKFNTAISGLMIFLNDAEKEDFISLGTYQDFLKLLAVFAPHITEEIWGLLGNKESIHTSSWPAYNDALLKDEKVKIMIQVNGKVRGEVMVALESDEETVKVLAMKEEAVAKHLTGEPKKIIYVKNKLINIVL